MQADRSAAPSRVIAANRLRSTITLSSPAIGSPGRFYAEELSATWWITRPGAALVARLPAIALDMGGIAVTVSRRWIMRPMEDAVGGSG